jgi:hypothetical protein
MKRGDECHCGELFAELLFRKPTDKGAGAVRTNVGKILGLDELALLTDEILALIRVRKLIRLKKTHKKKKKKKKKNEEICNY